MDAQSYHFIIADDDEHVRFFVKHVISLTFPDARIASFGDGCEAWDYYQAHGADAVVTDYDMPGMTGTELIRAIRRKDSRLAIVMVSNSPKACDQERDGVDVFMGKEGILRHLSEVLKTLLAGRGHHLHERP